MHKAPSVELPRGLTHVFLSLYMLSLCVRTKAHSTF